MSTAAGLQYNTVETPNVKALLGRLYVFIDRLIYTIIFLSTFCLSKKWKEKDTDVFES